MSRGKRWLPGILNRVHTSAQGGQVSWTRKALYELASLELGLDKDDVRDVLMNLTMDDWAGREMSRISEEWMYIFTPRIGMKRVYLKMVFRNGCVLVSFHEDRKR